MFIIYSTRETDKFQYNPNKDLMWKSVKNTVVHNVASEKSRE